MYKRHSIVFVMGLTTADSQRMACDGQPINKTDLLTLQTKRSAVTLYNTKWRNSAYTIMYTI